MEFGDIIINWYKKNKRDLPWRNCNDPYKIWLSEIILQQTRVDQGMPYYKKFVETFPTVFDLANSSEDKVLKLWQGLGYYTRARNLHATAKRIVKDYNGIFPDSYEELIKLKGIGSYTGAAIASFAFKIPVPVVDGNVYRLLSRYFGIETPIDSNQAKKEFFLLASELINKKHPELFNQGIMEFGSLQCKPSNPDCLNCPLNLNCIAFARKNVANFPVKSKSIKTRNRYFHYLYIRHKNHFVLTKRIEKDIWKNLYELPLIETNKKINAKKMMDEKQWEKIFGNHQINILSVSRSFIHQLSHQSIQVVFYEIELKKRKSFKNNFFWVDEQDYHQYAIPKPIERYLHAHLKDHNA